ncbi:MAG: VWA domain-containing protein [Acidimicrobiales bacterium]
MTQLLVLRPAWLALLVAGPALVWAWRRWPPPLTRGRSRLALALRLGLVLLLALALADVRVGRRPRHRAVVAVVDLSDSTGASQEQASAAVTELMESKGTEDLFGVVTFGRDAQVELPPSVRPTFSGFQTRPDPSYSNVAGALGLAANLMPDGYGRQIVLVSDGRQNLGDASLAVDDIRSRSVRVDVVPVGAPAGDEVLVAALEAPHELRVGQALTATARIRATAAARGRVVFSVDGVEVQARPVELPAGASEARFDLGPLDPGLHRLRVAVDARPDGYTQNDEAEAVVRVLDRPAVLLLEGSAGQGANVVSALEASGMRVETRPAAQSPTEAAAFAAFDSVVVVGASAEAFPGGGLSAIAGAVRDLGRGLVAIGGPATYGPGGWQGTPLEEALPVSMDIPRPQERPAVAVAVVVETMEEAHGDLVALGSVDAVVDQLKPDDEVAVVGMHQSGPSYIVPLTRPTDRSGIKQRIRFAALGDPPGYADSVTAALDAVAASNAANKHVVVVGDGDAQADLGRYDELFARARELNVVVSVIGVSTHDSRTDMDHMRVLAGLGGGRYYESDSAGEVPAVLLDASRSALRPWYEQTPFFPTVTSAGDLLDGVDLEAFPELGGYVATTPKPTADVVLASPRSDPVLAAGQFGLGRSVAWTSDAEGRWTQGLLRSPVAARLFGRMVAWSLPSGAGGPGDLRIDTVADAAGLNLTVSGPTGGGELQTRVVDPDQQVTDAALSPEAPGRWQGVVAAPAVGTYLVNSVLRRDGEIVARAEAAAAVAYAPEYLELGRDDGLLVQLAGQGGTLLDRAGAAWDQPLLPLAVTSPLFWLLLALFAVLWPADVALRRLTMSPRQVVAGWREARALRRPATRAAAGPRRPTAADHRPGARGGSRRLRRAPVEPGDDAGTRPEPVTEPALASRLLEARRTPAPIPSEGDD